MPLPPPSPIASNWVDRGEPAGPVIERVLQFFFDRHDPADSPWLRTAAEDIVSMVPADATEVEIAAYLKSVARAQDIEFPHNARIRGIAVWHIAKVALVRDAASQRHV